MKREIKFRAWIPELKKITPMYGFTLNFAGEITTQNEAIIMQFTGLHDKKGKDIYEGDIVKYNYADYDEPFISQVEFSEGAFYPICEVPESETYFEVIGNIYENPELL